LCRRLVCNEQPLWRADDIASHTTAAKDSNLRWRKSAAVKRNSFARQAFLGHGRCMSRVDEFGRGTVETCQGSMLPVPGKSCRIEIQIDMETEQ